MLSTKKKAKYLEKRVKEYTKTFSKSLNPIQRMIMNSSLETISNLITVTSEDKLKSYLDLLVSYVVTLTGEYASEEELEEALDSVTSKNGY